MTGRAFKHAGRLCQLAPLLLVSCLSLALDAQAASSAAAAEFSSSTLSVPLFDGYRRSSSSNSLNFHLPPVNNGTIRLRHYPRKRLTFNHMFILDVNSLIFKGNHYCNYSQMGPDIRSSALCAQRCAHTTGCNAYVSCSRRDGCGRGCSAYVGANPTITSTTGGLDNYVSSSLPLRGFGFFTWPFYYMSGCSTPGGRLVHRTTEKWGWGLCSLYKLRNVSAPAFTNLPASLDEEFSTGILLSPPNCPKALPYSICAQCNALSADWQRASCTTCASFFRVDNPIREVTTLDDQPYDYCPRCFAYTRTPTDAANCVACLQSARANGKSGDGCIAEFMARAQGSQP